MNAQDQLVAVVDLSKTTTISPNAPAGQITKTHGRTQCSLIVYWPATGTPVGTFDFYASNDYDPIANTGNWTKITASISTAVNPAGTASGFSYQGLWGYEWFGFIYTVGSGTGSATVAFIARAGL